MRLPPGGSSSRPSVIVTVAGRSSGKRRVTPSTLPGGPAAVTTHHGRYEDLTAAYEAIAGWLKEYALEPAGPHPEVYYTDPQTEPDLTRWRTDLIALYRPPRRWPLGT